MIAAQNNQTDMKASANSVTKKSRYLLPALAFFVAMNLFGSFSAFAQAGELSLADLLIALRSKKASMPEKNKILAGAVNDRGITFTLTPEIEKELAATGASEELLKVIRIRQVPVRAAEAKPAPQPTPTPPDYKFFAQRAEENSKKGEFRLALADYNKAAEMKANDPAIILGRADTYFNLQEYNRSITDYDTTLKLNPKSVAAYFNRARAYEASDELLKSAEDYRKALEIEPENREAKDGLVRVLSALMAEVKETTQEADESKSAEPAPAPPELVKQGDTGPDAAKTSSASDTEKTAAAESKPTDKPQVESTPPEYVDAGTLSKQNAERMAVPVYPVLAQRSRIEGKLVVEVELDTEGNVVSAKAKNGQQMLKSAAEDAARKSKFKPVLFNGKPNKAKGVIIYNFTLNGTE